jgi:hypothetical protein
MDQPRQTPPSPNAADALGQDRLLLRVFTLADHAAVSPDGKLYLNGGSVSAMTVPQLPGPLGPLWLAILIRVPWHLTSEPLTMRLRVLTADRQSIGPDPAATAQFEVGRPPGARPGDELYVPFAIALGGFQVPAEGSIYFHLAVGEQLLGVLPLKVHQSQTATPPATPH